MVIKKDKYNNYGVYSWTTGLRINKLSENIDEEAKLSKQNATAVINRLIRHENFSEADRIKKLYLK